MNVICCSRDRDTSKESNSTIFCFASLLNGGQLHFERALSSWLRKITKIFSLCKNVRKRWRHTYSLSAKENKELTLKAPITTAADDIHKYFFFVFSEKIRLDISCESSALQRIHMKYQALFSSKEESKKIKVSSAAILLGALRVK